MWDERLRKLLTSASFDDKIRLYDQYIMLNIHTGGHAAARKGAFL